MTKPYADQTTEERLQSLDRMLNVLVHANWSEVYLRFSDEKAEMQRQMDEATNWDSFVAARAVKLYIENRVLNLRDLVNAERADLEADKATDEPLPPTDYEAE